jgi:hypothetical protein
MKRSFFISFLALFLALSCSGGGNPVIPGGDTTPPVWDGAAGLTKLVQGQDYVTLSWGTATDSDSPPVLYLVYKDTDDSPWDADPIVRTDSGPFTFEDIPEGSNIWFGVRCRDSADPPNIDTNEVVLKSIDLNPDDDGDGDGDGEDITPPAWDSTEGVTDVVAGDQKATVLWGTASDTSTPPVEYAVYMDTDSDPWDAAPVVRDNNDPYTFAGLTNGTEYWFGVRCRDSADPANEDENDIIKSAIPGDMGWALTWGGTGADAGYAVEAEDSGLVIVTGAFEDSVDFNPGDDSELLESEGLTDAFLSAFDATGDFKWTLGWGGADDDAGHGAGFDSSGNVYVSGTFSGLVDFDPGDGSEPVNVSDATNVFLSKFDPAATFGWVDHWGQYADLCAGLAVDESGNSHVAGTLSEFTYKGGFIRKESTDGSPDWLAEFGEDGSPLYVYDIAIDDSGSVFLTGSFVETIDFDPGVLSDEHTSEGFQDIYLMKLNPYGDFLWAATWGGDWSDKGFGVATDSYGNVYVSGEFTGTVDFDPGPSVESHSAIDGTDAFLCRFDPMGNFIWARTWGGIDFDSAYRVAADDSANIYVTGQFQDEVDFNPGLSTDNQASNGSSDIFLARYDGLGTYYWTRTWGGAVEDAAHDVAVDINGSIYVTGEFRATVEFDPESPGDPHISNGDSDVFLVKFLPDGSW